MMDVPDLAIVTIGVAGDKIEGRTTIQKLIYFETVFGLANENDVNYRPHYFGPYSSKVAGTLQELTALGFIKEEIETRETTGYAVPEEWKRYCYRLTEEGRSFLDTVIKEDPKSFDEISRLVEKCKRCSKLDPKILSWAAKVHYIWSKEGKKAMEFKEIKSKANTFKWDITEAQICIASDLLRDLDLVE